MLLRLVHLAATARPRCAVTIAAIVATMAATYPTTFCGRSLVSPNNGGTAMLYNRPPFVPGSRDTVIEDRRGADVGAAMWAFVPYSQVQREALAHKEWPLWNRYNSLGVPLWGQGQTFLLDPLHWVTLVTPDPALGWDLKFIAHRLVFAVGIGLAALAATGAWMPASIAAVSAPFIGLYAFRLNHPAVFSVTYAPWILLGWYLLATAHTWRARARGAVIVALASALVFVASPPKEAVVGLAIAEATGALIVLLTHGATAPAGRAWLAGGVAAAAALLVTAPHWLIFLDTVAASQTMYDTSMLRFGGAADAWALVLGPLATTRKPGVHLLCAVLVFAALGAPKLLRRQPMTSACLIGATGAFAIMFGLVPAEWLKQIPFIATISGLDHDVSTATLTLLLIASACGAQALAAHMSMALSQRGPRARVIAVACVVALMMVLLLPGGQHVETGIGGLDRILQQPRLRTALTVPSASVRAWHARGAVPSRVAGVDTWLYPGTSALYGLEGTGAPDALFLRTTAELLDTLDASARVDWARYFLSSTLARDAPLLDLLNVEYLLTPKADLPSELSVEATFDDDLLQLVRRPTAWPRAYFVDRLSTYTTPSDLIAEARLARGPIAAVQVDDAAARELSQLAKQGPGVARAAHSYVLSANTTTFRVRASGEGVAVLAESYVPTDFIATLNGQPVPYFRVNHAFKAVRIPGAGDWEVRFAFRPRRWSLAIWLAAAGAALVVAIGVAAMWGPARAGPG